MIRLPLVRCAAAMPEEQPLQTLVALQFIFEAELVLLVRKLEQIQQFGRGLHDSKGRGLRVVDDDGDAAVGVQAEEPFFLLLVGGDVDDVVGEFGAVDDFQLFEKDLDFLTIGGVLGN